MHWFVTSFGALLAWVATYFLSNQIPIKLEFSIWQPKVLFSTPLILSMDKVSWPLVMGVTGVFLVISLSLPSRDGIVSIHERVSVLIYSSFSLAAVLAGNILTVIITWMLMDGFIFTLSMRASQPGRRNDSFLWWFGKSLLAIVVLVFAAVINLSAGGTTAYQELVSVLSMILIIFSSLLRMPFPAISKYGEDIGWVDAGNKSTLDLFPMLSGVAVLAHVLEIVNSDESIIWLTIIGGLLVTLSLVEMIFFTFKVNSLLFLNLGTLGIGLLLASYRGGIIISAVGIIMISISSWLKFLKVHERWHSIVPILFTAMMAGMIGTPGGILSQVAAEEFIRPGKMGIELLVWIGMGLVSIFYFKFTSSGLIKWRSRENLTVTSYSLALMLFVSNTFLVGYKMNLGFSLPGIVYFLSLCLLIVIVLYSIQRVDLQLPIQGTGKLRFRRLLSRFNFIRIFGNGLLSIVSAVGNIFEGETGLLWALVILLLLILTLGGIG
jgi:hypothetical protein